MTLSLFLLPPLSLFVVTELTTKVIKDQGRGRAGQGKMGTMAKSWEWDGQMGRWADGIAGAVPGPGPGQLVPAGKATERQELSTDERWP